MRYFPLKTDRFEHQFGVRRLQSPATTIEATSRYDEEIALKRKMLSEDLHSSFQSLPGWEPAEQEVLRWITSVTPFLHNGHNSRTDEPISNAVPKGCEKLSSLLSVARHVQEDLVLLADDAAIGFPLVAGAVCFPSGWSIVEKIGKSMLEVHEPVPEFAQLMGTRTLDLLSRLKPHRPVWRMNWGVRPSDQLDQSPRHLSTLQRLQQTIDGRNAGARCVMRVERQTLTKLPQTGTILFTIHTYQCPVEELTFQQKMNLRGFVRTCPEATLRYKGIEPMRSALLEYLAAC